MPLYSYWRNHLLQIVLWIVLTVTGKLVHAQKGTPGGNKDTISPVSTLQSVRITAYEHNRILKDVPAAINYIGGSQLERFSSFSFVQAVNATPGVRMEERSPGSYRFNIRGSSLRSPFGVRNVKVYYNDIPFTDPGGNTYLNQFGFYNIKSIEVIKGPGSSLYGPGTGGVLLMESLGAFEPTGASLIFSNGSFGSKQVMGSLTTGNNQATSRFSIQHQQSKGYRDHSELDRDVYSWNGMYRLNDRQVIKTSFLYGDLFYETPGALNRSEFDANPRLARPGGGGFPGSIDAKASIKQKTFLSGASLEQKLNEWFRNKTVLYGVFTELVNPNLRGFEKNSLPHAGGRTSFGYQKQIQNAIISLDLGGEWQKGFQTIHVHQNRNGNADTLRSLDEIKNRNALVFAQAVLDLHSGWTIITAASFNWYKIEFSRFNPATSGIQTRTFNKELAPRFALMKKMNRTSIYASVSRGFSPPTTTELIPTGGAINLGLDAEDGINYEAGIKAVLKNRLSIDANVFLFRLDHTIVQRRDAGGGDYFINAGKTNQKGLETALSYQWPMNISVNGLAWINYTYHHFLYKEFKQLANDFSGNVLPGGSPHTIAAGWDVLVKNKWDAHLTYYYSDRIALNDANTAYADAYHLLGLKLGHFWNPNEKWNANISVGVENLLDERYSQGNDINGFGGRYFNAAPSRNFFLSLKLQWFSKKKKKGEG